MQVTYPAQWPGVVHAHPESASVSLAGQALRVTWEEDGLMEGSKDGRGKSVEKGWWGCMEGYGCLGGLEGCGYVLLEYCGHGRHGCFVSMTRSSLVFSQQLICLMSVGPGSKEIRYDSMIDDTIL